MFFGFLFVFVCFPSMDPTLLQRGETEQEYDDQTLWKLELFEVELNLKR